MGVARLSLIALVLVAIGGGVYFAIGPSPSDGGPAPVSGPPPVAPDLKVSLLAFGTEGRRAIDDAGAVAANEAVRIRVTLDAPAHILVGREDRLGGAHLMYPPSRAGGRAIALPTGGPHELGQPLKSVAGAEKLHIYACARSFTWGDVRSLKDRAGCARIVRALTGP